MKWLIRGLEVLFCGTLVDGETFSFASVGVVVLSVRLASRTISDRKRRRSDLFTCYWS